MGTISLPDNSTMVQTWDGVSLGKLTSIQLKNFVYFSNNNYLFQVECKFHFLFAMNPIVFML